MSKNVNNTVSENSKVHILAEVTSLWLSVVHQKATKFVKDTAKQEEDCV